MESILKKNFFKLFLIITFFSILTILSVQKAIAQEIFLNEDFNDGTANGWIEKADWGNWSIIDGEYQGTVMLKGYPEKPSVSYYPYLNRDNYLIELNIKNTMGVDKVIRFRFDPIKNNYYQVNLRSRYTAGGGGGNDLVLSKTVSGKSTIINRVGYENFENTWYRIKVIAQTNNIKVFVNNQSQLNIEDLNNPLLSGTVGLEIWPGGHTNPVIGNITTTRYDDIIISSFPRSPLIFLPGLTACWNGQALLSGQEGGEWILNPIAKKFFYQNLFDSFANVGLQENSDWRLFCYDWRKPLQENADKLNNFIQVNTSSDEKVNLVGHSMGGLVSRIYTQNHPEKVEKIITLGSPHEGSVRAYAAWEGGQIWEYKPGMKFLLELLLLINSHNWEHQVQTIRHFVPSLQDLLPTFDFLINDKTNEYKKIENHIWKNDTLNNFNQTLDPVKDKISTIYGTGYNTLDAIRVTSTYIPHANWLHQKLGLWDDGEPIHVCDSTNPLYCKYDFTPSMVYTNLGDGTVLAKSATISSVPSYEFTSGHNELVKEHLPINQIFSILGITPSLILPPELPVFEKALGLVIKSPAKIKIIDSQGNEAGFGSSSEQITDNFYDDQENFLIIPNPSDSNYQIEITGTGTGTYRLIISYLDQSGETNFWEYQLPTLPQKVDHFNLDLNQPDLPLTSAQQTIPFESLIFQIALIKEKTQDKCFENTLKQLKKSKEFSDQKKYFQANNHLEIALKSFNQCFLDLPSEEILDSISDYQSILKSFTMLYLDYSQKGNLTPDKSETERLFFTVQKNIKRLDQKFQKEVEKGKSPTYLQAILFDKSLSLLQEAENALKNNHFSKSYILLTESLLLVQKIKP